MPTTRTAVLLALLLLLLIASLYILAEYNALKGIHVALIEVRGLERLLAGGDRLTTVFNVSVPPEPIPVTICVDRLSGIVVANSVKVADFAANNSFCVNSGSWKLVELTVRLHEREILESIVSSLENGVVKLEVIGEALVPVTLWRFRLPLEVPVKFDTVRVFKLSSLAYHIVSHIGREAIEAAERLAEALGVAHGYSGKRLVEVNVVWLCGAARCPPVVKPGTRVEAYIVLQGHTRDVVVKLRVDRILAPDATLAERLVPLLNGTARVVLRFRVDAGPLTRGYFVEVDWPGGKWVMPMSERLRVG